VAIVDRGIGAERGRVRATVRADVQDVARGHGRAEGALPARVRWARGGYLVLAWALVACLAVQVFFAGLAIFVDPARWAWHREFVHAFEFLPLLMLALAFAGRLPRGMRWLTAALIGQIAVQYATAHNGGALAALHPVNAMVFFWLAVTLGHRAWRCAQAGSETSLRS
jgi:membrane-bound metal-dependent hydrolase YbcI (DUF457 family)